MNETFDYREFLKHRFEDNKSTRPQFSARYFARRAGMSSPSYFSMIVSGKRKLSLKFARKVAKGLNLSDQETKLVVKAVELESSDDPRQKIRLMDELKKLGQKIHLPKLVPQSQIEILSRPLELALYVLSQSNQFKYNLDWIRKQPGFSEIGVTPLKKAMQTLVDSGLWRVDDNQITVRPPNLESSSRSPGTALQLSHLRFLEIAKNSLIKANADQRVFVGQTFLCDPNKMKQIEKRLSEIKSEFETEFEDLNSTSVYQLHIGFFPLKSLEDSRET